MLLKDSWKCGFKTTQTETVGVVLTTPINTDPYWMFQTTLSSKTLTLVGLPMKNVESEEPGLPLRHPPVFACADLKKTFRSFDLVTFSSAYKVSSPTFLSLYTVFASALFLLLNYNQEKSMDSTSPWFGLWDWKSQNQVKRTKQARHIRGRVLLTQANIPEQLTLEHRKKFSQSCHWCWHKPVVQSEITRSESKRSEVSGLTLTFTIIIVSIVICFDYEHVCLWSTDSALVLWCW